MDRAYWRKPADPLSFGAWRTTHIAYGWGKFRSSRQPVTVSGNTAIDVESFKRPYRIQLQAGSGVISAECLTRGEGVSYKDWSLDSGALQGIPPLHCSYAGAAEGEMPCWRCRHRGFRSGEHRVRCDPLAHPIGQSHRGRARAR